MKQTTKIALAVAAGAAALLLKKTRSVDGIGALRKPKYKFVRTVSEGANMLNNAIMYMPDGKLVFRYQNEAPIEVELERSIHPRDVRDTIHKYGRYFQSSNFAGVDVYARISGNSPATLPKEMLIKLYDLFSAYDEACDIAKVHDAASEAIFEDLDAQGIDWRTDAGAAIANKILFEAGLSDENGRTDVYVNRVNARRELLNFIYDNILPLFPLKQSDIALFRNDYSIIRQDKLLDLTRNFLKLK